mgnify:CR=1 FL=1
MPLTTAYPHIEERDDGKLWLTGTQTKVVEVVLTRIAYHWDADEIQCQLPHLTLGQIYACLAYYHDHQAEMDQIIQDQHERVKRLRAQQPLSALDAKRKAQGLAS